MMRNMLMLMLGGALGTLARYGLSQWLNTKTFPFGTVLINVSGSFVFAGAALLFLERGGPGHEHWFLLVGSGFCGGFTTFSAFEWETFSLVRNGHHVRAMVNVAGSVVAGFLGVLLAFAMVHVLWPRE
jgi:CrcB protein